MKKWFYVVLFLLFGLIIIVLAEEYQIPIQRTFETNIENYSLQIITRISWGLEEGQFPLPRRGEYIWMPEHFLTDNNGNMYIADVIKGKVYKIYQNRRIKILEDVNFPLGFFSDNTMLDYKGNVFDNEGKLLYKIKLPYSESPPTKFLERANGETFLIFGCNNFYLPIEFDKERNEAGAIISKFKNNSGQNVSTFNSGSLSKYTDFYYDLIKVNTGYFEFNVKNKEGNNLKIIKLGDNESTDISFDSCYYIGEDKALNQYFLCCYRLNTFPVKFFSKLRKYTPDGNLVLSIIIPKFDDIYSRSDNIQMYQVDKDGNIYNLGFDENELSNKR